MNDREFALTRESPSLAQRMNKPDSKVVTKWQASSIYGWNKASPNRTLNDDLLAIDLNTNDFLGDIITSKVDQIIQVSHDESSFPQIN